MITMTAVVIVIIYFITAHLLEDKNVISKSQIQRIRERGYLLAATDKNTLNYFIYRGEAMGYQLELLESFAHYLGVPLRLIACDNISRMEYYLTYRAADIIALNLPVSSKGEKHAHFTHSFGETKLVVVQRQASSRASLQELEGDTIYVRANPFMTSLYDLIKSEGNNHIVLHEVADTSQTDLVRMVSEGSIPFTLCEQNLAIVMQRAYTNLNVGLEVSEPFEYAWSTYNKSDSLATMLNSWIDSIQESRKMRKIYTLYFESQKTTGFLTGKYSSILSHSISPYDREIMSYSKIIGWDWRLIASLMYEESNFLQGQVSHHSASGLMQMVPETAEKFGLDSTSGPAHQIAAGIKYLKWIDKQLPDEIIDQRERVSFILASYNVGIGRVLALRKKASHYGKDPNRWHGHVEYYLLKRSRKDPYAKSDAMSVFPVNYSTEGYVDGIVARYLHYRNLIPIKP